MTKFLIGLSISFGVVGIILLISGGNGQTGSNVANLPTMMLGIGLLAAGCLTAILARVAQADRHHNPVALTALLETPVVTTTEPADDVLRDMPRGV
jgi:hypothetical protein